MFIVDFIVGCVKYFFYTIAFLFLGLVVWDFFIKGNWFGFCFLFGLLYFIHKCFTYNKPKLEIELVPAPMAGLNARAVMDNEQWKKIASICHKEHHYHCACCRVTRVVLECHEVWDYSDNTMKLVGLQSLCHECHMSKHILFAKRELKVPYKKILRHVNKVFGVGSLTLPIYIFFAKRKIKHITNEVPLDLTFLNNVKYSCVLPYINRPPNQYKFSKNENNNCVRLGWKNYS